MKDALVIAGLFGLILLIVAGSAALSQAAPFLWMVGVFILVAFTVTRS